MPPRIIHLGELSNIRLFKDTPTVDVVIDLMARWIQRQEELHEVVGRE